MPLIGEGFPGQAQRVAARHLALALVSEGITAPAQIAAPLQQAAVLQIAMQGQHFGHQLSAVVDTGSVHLLVLLAQYLALVGELTCYLRGDARFTERITAVNPLPGRQIQRFTLQQTGVVERNLLQIQPAACEHFPGLQVIQLVTDRRQRRRAL